MLKNFRKGEGVVGCGCLIVLLIIIFTGYDNYRKEERRDKRQKEQESKDKKQREFQDEVESFGKNKAGPLYQGLRDIRAIKGEIQGKRDELERVLNGLGKSTDEDEDYGNFSKLLEEIAKTENKLKQDLDDAFLLYKKFQISSDKSLETQINTIVSGSLASSEEIKGKYKTLKEKYSGAK